MILVCKGCEWHHLCLRRKVTAVVKWSMSPTSQKATISSEVVHAWTFSPPLYVICIPFDLSTIIYLPPSPSKPYCLWPSAKKSNAEQEVTILTMTWYKYLYSVMMPIVYYSGTKRPLILFWIAASNIIHVTVKSRHFRNCWWSCFNNELHSVIYKLSTC